MKFLLCLLFTCSLSAKTLEVMKDRLDEYNENESIFLCAQGPHDDQGLFVDISCSFKCQNSSPRIERISSVFSPKQWGLVPGNGSSDKNIIWASLGVGLKSWSQNLCLAKGISSCGKLTQLEDSQVAALESGTWSLKKFPTCTDKSNTLSPFDHGAGTKRMIVNLPTLTSPAISTEKGFSLPGSKILVPYGKHDFKTCTHKIEAKVCFGDCVDLSKANGDYVETLGTASPLGKDEIVFCADELVGKLNGLSANIKTQICEDYFWKSLLNSENMVKSCAAIRGQVDCKSLLKF